MKARAWMIAASILVPVAALLWGSWIQANGAASGATAHAVITARHEREIESLEKTQQAVREGIVEIRTHQNSMTSSQERILDEIKSLKGG